MNIIYLGCNTFYRNIEYDYDRDVRSIWHQKDRSSDSKTFSFKNVLKIEIAQVLMLSHYLDRTGQLQRRIERVDLFMSDEKKLAACFPRRKRDGILAAR